MSIHPEVSQQVFSNQNKKTFLAMEENEAGCPCWTSTI